MFIKTGIKQAFRTPRRLIAYFLVTAVVCAFLCVGVNLKRHADANLDAIINNFNVVAYPDFQAYITSDGSLSTDPLHFDSVGYYPCWAETYDLERIRALPGVTDVQVTNQFGGYVSNAGSALSARKFSGAVTRYYGADVIIFEYAGKEPFTVRGYVKTASGSYRASQQRVQAKLLWSAAGKDLSLSGFSILNNSHNTFVLEPGKQYIVKLGPNYRAWTDPYHNSGRIVVSDSGVFSWMENSTNSPFMPIYEYTEVFWDTDEGRYFKQAAEACMVNENSLTVMTTGDLSSIPAWSSGGVTMAGGRAFTQEDYDHGEKVCLVSLRLATEMGWKIGDTLDFSFYESQYPFGGLNIEQISSFDPLRYHSYEDVKKGAIEDELSDHFFDSGTFTIIGFYGGKVSFASHNAMSMDKAMDWMTVIVPSASVANQPEPKLSQYTTSIRLEPLKVQEFLAAAQASGLMDEQQFGYQLGLTVEDHGLSNLASGLESLDQISSLTLMLAIITAALAVAVLSILHLLQNKKQIASLRSMGVKRGQVAACILSGILLTCILGAAVGAFAGQMLSVTVTEKIMASAEQDTFDDTFSAMIATYHAYDEYEMTTTADPRLTILAGGSVALALTLFSAALVLHEGKKPPLLTLGVKE